MFNPSRQYVAVRLGNRTYTYHNDGAPVAAGDRVEVETRNGKIKASVESVGGPRPSFATKPIAGVVKA